MKSYGVNWFLVWVALVVLFCPIYLWAKNVLLLPWPQVAAHLQPPILVQALGQSFCWSVIFYYLHGKTLADPKAVERARQSLQRSKAARHRRYRWPIMWAIVFALVGTLSIVCKLIFNSPPWPHVVGYSLLLPCSSLAAMWLMNEAASKGQLAQLLEGAQGGSMTSD